MTDTENGDAFAAHVVMVTGGSGLVGEAIRHYVEETGALENEEWIYLSSKDGDLRNRKDTEAIFEKVKPTHVIHLAAKVGGLFANMAQKVRTKYHNMESQEILILKFPRLTRDSITSYSTCIGWILSWKHFDQWQHYGVLSYLQGAKVGILS